MDQHRAAMLVLVVSVLAVLFATGRHAGRVSGTAARTVSNEPTDWVGISGDVLFSGFYPAFVNNMTDIDIIMTKPGCVLPSSLVAGQRVVGTWLKVSCPAHGGSAAVELFPLAAAEHLALNIPIDLNRATAADLEKIPGVGPVMAERIVRFRQNNGDFVRVSELLMVEGIGAATYRRLEKFFQITENK